MDVTDASGDSSATLSHSLLLLLAESLPLSLPVAAAARSPPPPFLFFFPWNPFHIIKDTQMKWTLRKSGFQRWRAEEGGGVRGVGRQAGGGGGGGAGEANSPPLPHLHPPLNGGPPWRKAEWSGSAAPINIISVINIKSALLCFAAGSGPRRLGGPLRPPSVLVSFLTYFLLTPPPIHPHPPSTIKPADHNLLW